MKIIDAILASYSATASYPKFLRVKGFRVDSLVCDSLVNLGIPIIKLLYLLNKKSINSYSTGRKIIVSLTSYPARINTAWITIESLINQKRQPDKIILWLSNAQFQSIDSLPTALLKMRDRGLDIRLVDGDIKSHKKYAYVFNEYPDDYVIIADDDIVYPSDMIEKLMKGFTMDKVHCSYGSIVRYDNDGNPVTYKNWQPVLGLSDDPELFFGSGGGTLMVPSSLHRDCCNIDMATSLCPTADDIWLNTMARLAKLKIKKVRSGLIFPNVTRQKDRLWDKNVGKNLNDIQIGNIKNTYPSVFINKETINA